MSFVSRQRGEVWFLGIVTAGSLIHEALPRWGDLLGRRLSVRGVDLPLDSTEPDYERFCADLLASEEAVGAVIT